MWYADFDTSDTLEACNDGTNTNSCGLPEACSGAYTVYINDTNVSDCNLFDIVQLTYRSNTTASTENTSSNAECSAGSGRFALLPVLYNDMNVDNSYGVTFLPVQKTGTGVMTRQAWVSSISPVNFPSGTVLRVIKQTPSFHMTDTDTLASASEISTQISGTTSFGSNVLRGDPPFVAENIPLSDLGAYEVDMTWTCGSGGNALTLPQGYQFRLSDIGCSGNQKFTLRYATNPKRVYLELYGNPNFRRVEPTSTTSDGQAFIFEQDQFLLDAAVVSTSSSQAVVKINEISINGTSYCTPGTYTFQAE